MQEWSPVHSDITPSMVTQRDTASFALLSVSVLTLPIFPVKAPIVIPKRILYVVPAADSGKYNSLQESVRFRHAVVNTCACNNSHNMFYACNVGIIPSVTSKPSFAPSMKSENISEPARIAYPTT